MSRSVRKASHIIIQNVQVHGFIYCDDLISESLSNITKGFECVVILLTPAMCMAYLMMSFVLRDGWPTPRIFWVFP
jgi:hypothetical protein